MKRTITRAQFLRGNFRGRNHLIRPPWHASEPHFVDACTRCSECIAACPEKIIQKDRHGFPMVSFQSGECTFCAACAQQCPTQALNYDQSASPWSIRAGIGDACLPLKGVVCMSCADECELRAIRLRMVAGGVAIPVLDTETCNGCGACVQICPTSAIAMHSYGEDR